MRIRWWQSIRWRLAIVSTLPVLLATSVLTLMTILVTGYSYGADQQHIQAGLVQQLAKENQANLVNALMREQGGGNKTDLAKVASEVIKNASPSSDQQFMVLVFGPHGMPLYTNRTIKGVQGSLPASTSSTSNSTVNAQYIVIRNARQKAICEALRLGNPSIRSGDCNKLNVLVNRASSNPVAVDDEFGRDNAVGYAQPFAVRPILVSNHLVGTLVVTATKPSGKIQAFVTTAGLVVGVSSLVIAVLAALAALIFSRTITRPLVKLTHATRQLAVGNYSTQVPTNAAGELGELSHNFNDMATQLKQDVEQLRQQEIWRRELIMNITHDLATPLTAIAGLGEALVDGINQSREDYEATGRIIVRETLRLRRLVQDLHIMAKVEAGALQPKKKVLRLAALVDEVLAVLAPEFERHQIEPNNAISYSLPGIEADPDMLTRVLSNLCGNSLRHTPPGGMVTVEAKVQETERRMLIAVTDTGEGIPVEALPRIFERFYRADSTRQSSTGGSGLGLAIVRAIIEAHHGVVWAENVSGGGARIVFTLPLNKELVKDVSDETTIPLSIKWQRFRKRAQERLVK
jgi:signal transduction histidine kinase